MMSDISLKKSVFLISLALLAPEIQAENLNFNYRTADIPDFRSGLQARACHSKVEPMDIVFKFDKITLSSIEDIELTVTGDPISKSYAALTSPVPQVPQSADTDEDFKIPFEIKVNGSLKGEEDFHPVTGITYDNYTGKFCFSPRDAAVTENLVTLHNLRPNFDEYSKWNDVHKQSNVGTHSDYVKYCAGKKEHTGDDAKYYFWNGGPVDKNSYIPTGTYMSIVYNSLSPGEQYNFLMDNIFYTNRNPVTDTRVKGFLKTDKFNILIDDEVKNGVGNTNVYKYTLSQLIQLKQQLQDLSYCNSGGISYCGGPYTDVDERVRLDDGVYTLTLSNRNISALKLVVNGENSVLAEWEWKASPDDPMKNRLKLETNHVTLMKAVYNNDAYQNFYSPGGADSYFKGTLVQKDMLNNNYKDFIEKMPLSQPAVSQGDINLINTESLTFLITGKTDQAEAYSGPSIAVYGQPLKFAPLNMNGNEILSAMKVRNACY